MHPFARTIVAAVLCLLAATRAFAGDGQTTPNRQVFDLSLEDLLQMKVITASRTEEELRRSTSVMSVITARDIERAGFRTLDDALARVPGFFPTSQATWKLVGTRGLVADGNDHILLLIDGHPQNSIVAHGFQQQDQMPTLEKVERIEIIRGPGSVHWGASAAHAIINVVTKDGIDGDKSVQVSTGYALEDGLWTLNLQRSLRLGDATGLLSASYWQADGYNTPVGPNVKFPWGASANLWPRLEAQNPGFELYFKLRQEETQQIVARVAQTSVPYPWDSWSYDPTGGVRPGAELRMRKAYLNYQNTQTYEDRLKMEYTLYGDLLMQNRFPTMDGGLQAPLDTRWIEDQSREELALGADATATYQLSASHTLRFGTKYVHTVVGPNRGFRFDTATNLPTEPAAGEAQVPVVDVPSGNDNSIAVYAEDRLRFNDGRTDVFAGARADYNDWRERRVVLLPRAGIIHTLAPTLTAKYVFNTGYLRPNAAYSKSDGKFYRSPSKTIEDVNIVDRSEQVRSHDLQLAYGDRSYVVGTLFYMTVDNFISWETKLDLGYRNMGAAHSYGAEVEGRYLVTSRLALSGPIRSREDTSAASPPASTSTASHGCSTVRSRMPIASG
jgi:outer membrane receptor for ferrienterochelin and colicin